MSRRARRPECTSAHDKWHHYALQYQSGRPGAEAFCNAILEDVRQAGADAAVLDIGCGRGMDWNAALQESIGSASGRYIGIEPDREVAAPRCFETVYRCTLEESPLDACSIDVAYAAFVLEHVPRPEAFFRRLWEVLKPGGVFWGLTSDSRHPFAAASRLAGAIGLKDWYLDRLGGTRGQHRYENYPTYYLANSPGRIARHTRQFKSRQFMRWHRVGELDGVFPRPLHRRPGSSTA